MNKLVFILLAIAGIYYFKPGLLGLADGAVGAFNDDGSPKVLLFVNADCGGPCDETVAHLEKKEIGFELIDLDSSEQSQKDFRRFSKRGNTIPLLVVGDRSYSGFQNKRFNEVLYNAVGEDALDWPDRNIFSYHFYDDGSPRLVMYGANWCGYCAKAREMFNDRGIDYIEWDVEKDHDANERYRLLQAPGYPLIYVGTERIGGFSERAILDALETYDI